MNVERIFLGRERPALVVASDLLQERFGTGNELDLSRLVVVLPGRRAGRVLLAELAMRSRDQRRVLHPPRVVTPPELVRGAVPPGPLRPASRMLCLLAWQEELRSVPVGRLKSLLPRPPRDRDGGAWRVVARKLASTHARLTAAGKDFASAVVELECAGVDEGLERWRVAATLEVGYRERLASAGQMDESLHVACAVREERVLPLGPVVLLGVVEPGGLLCSFLGGDGTEVLALVQAPEEEADRFDALGALRVESWPRKTFDIDPELIEVVDGPLEQAEAVLGALASRSARGKPLKPGDVVVGIPDRTVATLLLRRAEAHGVPIRDSVGRSVARSGPCRLLEAVAELLEHLDDARLADLIRHPDVERSVLAARSGGGAEDWIDSFDGYQKRHVLRRLDPSWFAPGVHQGGPIPEVRGAIVDWFGDLCPGEDVPGAEGLRRPLAAWARPVAALLQRVYGGQIADPSRPAGREAIESCRALLEILEELGDCVVESGIESTAAEALRIILEEAEAVLVPPSGDDEAIELLGWLELPLEEAPFLVLTGLNEGRIPASLSSDWLLDERTMLALGLPGSRERMARDAYGLETILRSRPGGVHLLLGRTDLDGGPLLPSRLLLAGPDEELPARVLRFVGPGTHEVPRPRLEPVVQPGKNSRFEAFPRIPALPPTRIRVTSFRRYLADPYAYYLGDVLGLVEREESAMELDPGAFGTLLHTVLQAFGVSGLAASSHHQEILGFCQEVLDETSRRLFGGRPPAAVGVQLQSARFRLEHFAQWQAHWVLEGWRIEAVEWSPEGGGVQFDVDGDPMIISGKIDRIDRHQGDGRVAILDYKTGDEVREPGRTHRDRDGRWIDLQLPLYRHLAAPFESDRAPVLGYVALPGRDVTCTPLLADWSADELEDADEVARDVIRRIRAGDFLSPEEAE